MKRLVLAALLLVSGTYATPAHALGAGAFTADVTLNGYGVGAGNGTARLCYTGVNGLGLIVSTNLCTSITGSSGANVTANFNFNVPAGSCPAVGNVAGAFAGAIAGNFNWTHVGAVAVIGGTSGAGVIVGVATFAVTSPLGNPCGTPITSTVKATAVGALTIVP